MLIKRGLLLAAAGLITIMTGDEGPTVARPVRPDRPGGAITLAPRPEGPAYAPYQLEYYLTPEQSDFIRPGYHITINTVTIGANLKPVVDVNLTDDLGAAVDRNGVQTPGTCSTSFVLSWYNPATRDYTSYVTRQASGAAGTFTQATSDSGGVYNDIDVGHFTYTFKNALPAGFDQTKTHTLGMYGTRTMPTFVPVLAGKTYNANAEFDFRPDGQGVTDTWDQIRQATACNTCHDPLVAHGRRQDAKLCVLCHSPQTTDAESGNPVDFRIFIHKIHRGSSLPSVVAGTPYHISSTDFSDVVFPQDIRNCSNCHSGRDSTNVPTQSFTWYTYPSRAACGSCHDDINWVTGANHPAGAQADDSQCASCHAPQGNNEWDASVTGAHTVPDKSKQLPGLNAAILGVSNVAPGQSPTVTFQLTNGDGSILNPANIGASASLSLVLAGPTTDYGTGQAAPAQPISESATGANFNGSVATYTFTHTIPANATGTWAIAVQTRRTITFSPAPRLGPTTFTEGPANNAVTYIAVTDATAVPRRTVVALSNCNMCHDRLATTFSHGGQRISIEYCVFCHNPNGDDSSQRPAAQNPPESISFKRMIHRIHTGANLTQPFTIYGFGGSVNTFNDVLYPGNTKNCVHCHTATSTYSLPLATGTIPTITQRDYFSPQGAATAACLGCHDNQDAAAHAYLNTVMQPFFGEACATCHGTGAQFDVVMVHAQ
jgi:OmcA/MtrC family decaheme c-type cytochrome